MGHLRGKYGVKVSDLTPPHPSVDAQIDLGSNNDGGFSKLQAGQNHQGDDA